MWHNSVLSLQVIENSSLNLLGAVEATICHLLIDHCCQGYDSILFFNLVIAVDAIQILRNVFEIELGWSQRLVTTEVLCGTRHLKVASCMHKLAVLVVHIKCFGLLDLILIVINEGFIFVLLIIVYGSLVITIVYLQS
jgi:hypothetical protein